MNVLVTGIGVISSIGMNVEESLEAFRSGRRGLGDICILETRHRNSLTAGEVLLDKRQLLDRLGLPETYWTRTSRTGLLGMLAARECMEHAGAAKEATALVSATTVGGMDKTEEDFPSGKFSSGFITSHPCGDSTDAIADFLGLTSYRTTLSTACSSGANAMIHAARLITSGKYQRVLAGGVDALSRFTLNGFSSLMILDPDLCRPFDRERKGLNLGEGAAYLMLESEASARERGAQVLGRLSGYSNTNDAYHQTASSPDGEAAYAAMGKALAMAGLRCDEVSYINAHGTGTENNDASEGRALQRLFGDKLPPFSSTKSFTGHTLGAAAGLEAVFSVLSLRHGIIYPSLGFRTAMEDPAVVPETSFYEGREISHVLSNSFGFGGNNSTLIFSKT